MHRDFFQDEVDDYLRELAIIEAEGEFEYRMWLERENEKIKPITKVEIVEIKEEEHKQITL